MRKKMKTLWRRGWESGCGYWAGQCCIRGWGWRPIRSVEPSTKCRSLRLAGEGGEERRRERRECRYSWTRTWTPCIPAASQSNNHKQEKKNNISLWSSNSGKKRGKKREKEKRGKKEKKQLREMTTNLSWSCFKGIHVSSRGTKRDMRIMRTHGRERGRRRQRGGRGRGERWRWCVRRQYVCWREIWREREMRLREREREIVKWDSVLRVCV